MIREMEHKLRALSRLLLVADAQFHPWLVIRLDPLGHLLLAHFSLLDNNKWVPNTRLLLTAPVAHLLHISPGSHLPHLQKWGHANRLAGLADVNNVETLNN